MNNTSRFVTTLARTDDLRSACLSNGYDSFPLNRKGQLCSPLNTGKPPKMREIEELLPQIRGRLTTIA